MLFKNRKIAGVAAAGSAAIVLAGVTAQVVFAANIGLSGSNFEIDDNANLKVDAAGALDWNNVANTAKNDAPTGTQDNSFGQGTKENTAVPTIVSGSIPPNKSDLKVFGTYQEGSSTDGFLHLYWTRVQDPTGTTNMDFEFNQSETLSANGVTPVRTEGDLLITYDLSQGGTNPVLGSREWTGSSWGPYDEFTDGNAIGSINTTAIPAGESEIGALSARTFGEATIRLSAILPEDECTTFGSAYLKSRSSDSFTAALKDFIAPEEINVTNCGAVNIVKTDDAGNALAGAEFTLYNNNAPLAGPRGAEDTITNPALKCTTIAAGTCSIANVPFGNYWVVETVTPSGHSTAPDQATTISSGTSSVTLTFVNPRQRGAIEVTKTFEDKSSTSTPKETPHAGVTFRVRQSGETIATGVTDSNGVVCFDGLLFGTYNVVETVPEKFHAKGATTKSVTVDNSATCAGTPYTGESVAFVNVPLSDIEVKFYSQVTGANGPATAATIDCAGLTATPPDGTPNAFDDTSERFNDLEPGTYTCTVVVDP